MSQDKKEVINNVSPQNNENYINDLVWKKNCEKKNLNESNSSSRTQMLAKILFRLNRIKKAPDRNKEFYHSKRLDFGKLQCVLFRIIIRLSLLL